METEPSVERFIEKVGLRFEQDGLPRIGGRILGYLLLSPEPRTLDEIADALRVSKASVSSNTRMLGRMGSVERVTRRGDRRDFYRIAPDLHTRMLSMWVSGFRETGALLEWALSGGLAGDAEVRERLETFASFFAHMLEVIQGAQARWLEGEAGSGGRIGEME